MKKVFIGIDEVGRGPLAGPVCVCAFLWRGKRFPKELRGIQDSKILSEKKREEWFEKILKLKEKGKCDFSLCLKTANYIDKYGITRAINSCISNALKNLNTDPLKCHVLLDGGLKAPKKFLFQETIIKGDAKEYIISASSILAKVSRDNFMKNLGTRFPKYGFEIHKGYATKAHRNAIFEFGMCKEHRASYVHLDRIEFDNK